MRRVLRVVVWSCLAGLVIVVVAAFPIGRGYVAHHIFTTEDQKPLTLSAHAGDRIEIHVELCCAAGGHWATDGLVFRSSSGGDPVQVGAAKPVDWGDRVLVHGIGGAERFTVPVIMTVPVPAAGSRVLDGSIEGTVWYPAVKGLARFADERATVSVPVKIRLSAADWNRWLGVAVNVLAWSGFALVAALLTSALTGLVGAVAAVARGRVGRPTAADVLIGLGGGAMFGALATLVAGVALLGAFQGVPDAAARHIGFGGVGVGVAVLITFLTIILRRE